MTITARVLASDMEYEFVAWLLDRSRDVRWAYGRWLETYTGDCGDDDYCTECVIVQRYVERHQKTGYTRISGWNELQSQDGPRWCGRCDVLLYHSPTEHMIEEEMGSWADPHHEPSVTDCAILYNLMTCGGLYQMDRSKWWPLLEPHVERLMQEAKKARKS